MGGIAPKLRCGAGCKKAPSSTSGLPDALHWLTLVTIDAELDLIDAKCCPFDITGSVWGMATVYVLWRKARVYYSFSLA